MLDLAYCLHLGTRDLLCSLWTVSAELHACQRFPQGLRLLVSWRVGSALETTTQKFEYVEDMDKLSVLLDILHTHGGWLNT